MINELHKQTLRALGFEVALTPAQMSADTPVEEFHPDLWALKRNGKTIGKVVHTEEEAWSQAPSLEALMKPLLKAMTSDATPFRMVVFVDGNDWVCHLRSNDGVVYIDVDDAPSLEEAIAAVFLAACDAGLIDGKAVVL